MSLSEREEWLVAADRYLEMAEDVWSAFGEEWNDVRESHVLHAVKILDKVLIEVENEEKYNGIHDDGRTNGGETGAEGSEDK